MTTQALSIDVISDLVCPWCLIGSKRLDAALASFPDLDVDVRYHPFLLDPSMPAEGRDLRQHLRAKFGADPEAMFGRVESAARSSGIPLDFAKVRRYCNTVPAHTLLRHVAERPGLVQRHLARALFEAYFLEGLDIGDADELARIAARFDLSADEVKGWVTDEAELAETRAEAASAAEQGISGVPFVVLGDRLAVPGAQEPETFRRAIQQVLDARGASLSSEV